MTIIGEKTYDLLGTGVGEMVGGGKRVYRDIL